MGFPILEIKATLRNSLPKPGRDIFGYAGKLVLYIMDIERFEMRSIEVSSEELIMVGRIPH